MNTATVIGLGASVWLLLSVLLALFVGRMIRLRDRQRPRRSPAEELPTAGRAVTASSWHRPAGDRRDEF